MKISSAHNTAFLILFLCICRIPTSGAADNRSGICFLDREIRTAVTIRNTVYSQLMNDSADIDISKWDKKLMQRTKRVLPNIDSCSNAWQPMIKGMLYYLDDNEVSESFFGKALSLAEEAPGTTWLLFAEFNRYGLSEWVNTSLVQLEKQILSLGASSAPLLSRQLAHYGIIARMNGDHENAFRYFDWAHRFNPGETRSLKQIVTLSFPFHIRRLIAAAAEYISAVRRSWNTQLHFVYTFYSFFRQFIIIFILLISLTLCVKYFPRALHKLTHLFPDNVDLRLKIVSVSVATLSFLSFGIIPFLWLVAFLIWKYLSRSERILFGVVIGALILSPVDSAVSDRFFHAISPEEPIQKLSYSLNEGYVVQRGSLSATLEKNGKISLPLGLSATTDAIKSGNLSTARRIIRQLSDNYPNDPVVMEMEGIVHFLSGSIDLAKKSFKEAVDTAPRSYSAIFNLARCHIHLNNATRGMELLEEAAELNPDIVNGFIRKNDEYYSDNWPELRQVLFPDYTPARFWTSIFLPFTKNPATRRTMWGLSFLGFSPGVSFVLFLMFLGAVFFLDRLHRRNQRIRRIFECKYCGRIICRKCTTGILCDSCAGLTRYIKEQDTLNQIRNKIVHFHSAAASLRDSLFNLLLPGCGSLLSAQVNILRFVPLLVCTAIVYTYWFTFLRSASFSWMTAVEAAFIMLPPLLFHLYAAVRYLPEIIKRIRELVKIRLPERSS